jgi:hypothetical protein
VIVIDDLIAELGKVCAVFPTRVAGRAVTASTR